MGLDFGVSGACTDTCTRSTGLDWNQNRGHCKLPGARTIISLFSLFPVELTNARQRCLSPIERKRLGSRNLSAVCVCVCHRSDQSRGQNEEAESFQKFSPLFLLPFLPDDYGVC